MWGLIRLEKRAADSFVLGALSFWFISYATGLWTMRRTAARGFAADGLVLGPRQLRVDEGGIQLSANTFKQFVAWHAFKSISTQHLVLVLWTDKADGLFIPRSAFGSSSEEQRFLALVKARIFETGNRASSS